MPPRPVSLVKFLSLVLACAFLAGVLIGCQGKEISVATRAATITLKQVDDARAAHKISDKTWTETIVPARTATKALLDQIVADYVAGRPFDWQVALKSLADAIAPLERQSQLITGSTP